MKKILIIEDAPDSVEVVRRALASNGFQVFAAPDAETGLRMARAQLPDLILLDLGLPDYDGQTLIGWLRDEPALTQTPIIAFTAWPHETARQMVESYGCNGYIPKPIERINDFVETIKTFLKNSS